MIPGLLLYAVLVMPPVAAWLEGSMVGHMLGHLPLLALAGGLVARGVVGGRGVVLAGFNAGGFPGLLVATFAAAVWMLPRTLDAALRSRLVEVAKFTTVPLVVGVPLSLSWPLLPLVTRGLMGEPDFPCRSPWLALYRRAQSALHPLPVRSTGDCWGALLVLAMALLVGWGWLVIVGRPIRLPSHDRRCSPLI